MCLVNVAVTTLKHHNLILTTSLRRRRSDKHEELRRDEAGICPLRWAGGSRAAPTPSPARRRTRPIEQIWAWRASRSLLVGPRVHLNCKPTSAEGILRSDLLPGESPAPRAGGSPHPSPGRVFCSTGTYARHTQSFSHPQGFVSALVPGRVTAVPAEQGELRQPPLSPRSPALHPAARGPPAAQPRARRGDAGEEESLGPRGSLLWAHPPTHAAAQILSPPSGHQCLGQHHASPLHLAMDQNPTSELLLRNILIPGSVLVPYLRNSLS